MSLLTKTMFAFVLTLLTAIPVAHSEEQLTPDQIKKLALEAILENPEIISQALSRLEELEAERQQALIAQTLENRWSELSADTNAAVLGNPDGDITLVEFFDYNCPFCRRVKPEISKLKATDKNIRFVYREWPILGEGSIYAARAALASRKQGKYKEFHWALMSLLERAEKDSVLRVAEEVGLDIAKLQEDMSEPEVDEHIALSMEFAQGLNITGTPTFVLRDKVLPGLVPADQLAEEVSRLRASED